MNTTKRAIAFVIIIFLIVAVGIIYIFSELYTESEITEAKTNEDALKFKEEYEKINGVACGEDKTYRTLTISEDNPFIYSTEDDIVKRINDNETFAVYFGFSDCPWCRSVLNPMIDSAAENNIDKIYYVDVKNIRDTYVLDDKHTPIRSIEGTSGYYTLLEKLEPVLADYGDLKYTYKNKKKKKVTKSVKVNEKRIYAPNMIIVKKGVPIYNESGMVEELKDPYMEITDEMYKDIKANFNEAFKKLNESDACSNGKGC